MSLLPLLIAALYINCPVATLYELADPASPPVSQASYASEVTLLAEEANWSQIETRDGYSGWVESSRLLTKPDPAPTSRIAWVNSLYSHLYAEPTVTQHPPLLTLPFGTPLELLSGNEEERWLQVRLLDGRELYIHRGDMRFDPSPLSLEELLLTCRKFVGLPYTWGGTTSFGFDCSGFVQAMYRLVGIALPRDSRQQAQCGRLVAREELQPGDLLFFGTTQVSHVGLYLGEGQFIHSVCNVWSGPPGIRIQEIWEEELILPFICARRIYSF